MEEGGVLTLGSEGVELGASGFLRKDRALGQASLLAALQRALFSLPLPLRLHQGPLIPSLSPKPLTKHPSQASTLLPQACCVPEGAPLLHLLGVESITQSLDSETPGSVLVPLPAAISLPLLPLTPCVKAPWELASDSGLRCLSHTVNLACPNPTTTPLPSVASI